MVEQLISVVIPTYNRAAFIEQAIESVLGQTYPHYEVIVVDDGSTDNTRDLVAQYGEPVRYLYQTNQGVSVARNFGFANSIGNFLIFLDSDDFLLPTSLEILKKSLDTNPAVGVVHSDGFVVDEAGERVCELNFYRRVPFADTLDYFVSYGAIIGLHSALFRREILEGLEGPFDVSLMGQEDLYLYIALKLRGVRFEYIPEHTCCYRFHGQNLTAPASVLSEKVQKSRTRYKRKILSIPGFDNLSIETRYIFFLDYLTHILRGDYRKQKEVIDSSQFTRLPKRKQSQLIYYMCVENLLCDVRWEDQVSHLFTAMKINPQNLKLYWLLLISLLIPSWRRRIILWRRGLQKDEAVDPITYILEHKAEPS